MIMIFFFFSFEGIFKTRASFVSTSALVWPRQSKGHPILSPPCILWRLLGHVDRHSHDVTTSTGPHWSASIRWGGAMDLSLSCEAEGNKRARVVWHRFGGQRRLQGSNIDASHASVDFGEFMGPNFSWPLCDPGRACWGVFKPRAHAHPPAPTHIHDEQNRFWSAQGSWLR